MSELLIHQSTFDEWFGSDVPDDARKNMLGNVLWSWVFTIPHTAAA